MVPSAVIDLLRSIQIGGAQRPLRFFGMKGDLKWLSQVFKLSGAESFIRTTLKMIFSHSFAIDSTARQLSPRHWKGNGAARGNRTGRGCCCYAWQNLTTEFVQFPLC